MAIRKTKKIILIVCEGKNKTERLYFSNFINNNNEYNIKIENSEATDPKGMISTAKKYMKKYGIKKEKDIVFCLMDGDNDKEKCMLIKDLKHKHRDINIILSHPTFEIWYLLHYKYTTHSFDKEELIAELGKHIKNYQKNKNVYLTNSGLQNYEKATKNIESPHTLVIKITRVWGLVFGIIIKHIKT